ncbi:AAA domain-containing protein, partial [Haematococcus lacustris]
GHGKSKVNGVEAKLVLQVVLWLQRAAGLAHGSIGVVSPYAAQVELLKQKFLDASSSSAASAASASKQAAEGTAQSQGQGSASGGRAQGIIVVTAPAAGQVQVASVDGFQGREKEVIVFST